jgi:hypothetical protein
LSESTSAVARKKAPRGFHGWFEGRFRKLSRLFLLLVKIRSQPRYPPTNPQPFGSSGVGSKKSLTLHVHHNLNFAAQPAPQPPPHAKKATSTPWLLPGPLSTHHAALISRSDI